MLVATDRFRGFASSRLIIQRATTKFTKYHSASLFCMGVVAHITGRTEAEGVREYADEEGSYA
jgi:predicted transcriptional regulator